MMKRTIVVLAGLTVALTFFALGLGYGNPNERVRRFGSVIMVKPEMIEKYKRLHANPWPGVINKIHECNIRNYSIYLRELEPGKWYLFSYFEYVGNDFDGDMKKMAADPETQRWWKETDPCQVPVELHGDGEWWASMEEVFHTY